LMLWSRPERAQPPIVSFRKWTLTASSSSDASARVIQSAEPAIGQSVPLEEPEVPDEDPEDEDDPAEDDEPEDPDPLCEDDPEDDAPAGDPESFDPPLESAPFVPFAPAPSVPSEPPRAVSPEDEPSWSAPPLSEELRPAADESPPAAAFAAAFVIAALAVLRSFFAQPEPLNTKFGAAIALRNAWA
jgi:hypothetical protein